MFESLEVGVPSKASDSDNGGGGCVGVTKNADGTITFTDTKLGDASPALTFNMGEIAALLKGVETDDWTALSQS